MKSTFARTFFAVAVILLAALLSIGIVFQMLAKDYLTDSAVEGLKKDGKVIVQLVQAYHSDHPGSGMYFNVALTVASSISEADAVIFDSRGELVICTKDPLGCDHLGLSVNREFMEKVYAAPDGIYHTGPVSGLYSDVRHVICLPVLDSDSGSRLGMVMISTPVDTALVVLQGISRIFMYVFISAIALSVIMMTVFARKHASPLREMAKTANAFAHGDLSARVNTDGNNTREVEELARAFNNMATSLQKSEYQRQEFVANVSHELKTPMTSISGYVDGILDGTIPPEKQEHYLQIVSEETKRLNRLVRSMLDISRLRDQGGIPPEQLTRFDISECVGQVLITFENKINEKKLQVEVELPEYPVFAMANQDYITQVIYNLTDNAVKFSPEGGTLGIIVKEDGKKVYVSVSNDGPTIPAAELPLVFDRFHKIDKARSRTRDSWGLGLYIVKTIIDSHGENISVTSREEKTTFTFTLPMVN